MEGRGGCSEDGSGDGSGEFLPPRIPAPLPSGPALPAQFPPLPAQFPPAGGGVGAGPGSEPRQQQSRGAEHRDRAKTSGWRSALDTTGGINTGVFINTRVFIVDRVWKFLRGQDVLGTQPGGIIRPR